MIFDCNAFVGKWPYWPIRSTTAPDVVSELQTWKIDRAAICSTRSVFVNWEDGNREVEVAVEAHKTTLVPFACLGTLELSHALPSHTYDFAGYLARGFRGIRLYPQHHSYHPLYQRFVDTILEEAVTRNWPVLLPLRIIMNWGVPSLDPGVLCALVQRHPNVKWILAGINYLHELQLASTLLRQLPNVSLETSCIMGYAAIAKLVQEHGSEQILFGSGATIQHGAAALSKILTADISEEHRANILGGNFQRLIGEK